MNAAFAPSLLCRAKAAFARCLKATLCVLAVPAFACITEPPPIPRKHVVTGVDQPVSLVQMDLLTLIVPGKSGDWRLEQHPANTPRLAALTLEQLNTELKNPRFRLPSHWVDRWQPPQLGSEFHFHATGTGTATLVLINERRRPRIKRELHVDVRALEWKPPAIVRGSVKKFDQSQHGKSIGLQYYDTLEITLPGAFGDAWEIDAAAAGLRLRDKRDAGEGKVTFVFAIDSARENGVLRIQPAQASGTDGYVFPIEHRPTPVC